MSSNRKAFIDLDKSLILREVNLIMSDDRDPKLFDKDEVEIFTWGDSTDPDITEFNINFATGTIDLATMNAFVKRLGFVRSIVVDQDVRVAFGNAAHFKLSIEIECDLNLAATKWFKENN